MSRKGRALVAVVVVLGVVALAVGVTVVLAQQPAQPGGQNPGMMAPRPGMMAPQPGMMPGQAGMMGPQPGMMGPQPGMMGPAGMMMARAMAQPAIAVEGGKVYVAAAGRLYRFDAKTLKLEAQAEYAPMPPMFGPGGGRGMPGQPGMPGGGQPGMAPGR